MTIMRTARARAWFFFIVSCICGAALYVPHLNAPLVFDDLPYFGSNYASRCGIGFHGEVPRWWPCWTFAVPRVLIGEDILHVFRLGNLILHILTSNALFFFLRKLFTLLIPSEKTCPHSIDAMAGVAALIFLLHPISVYAAQYLVERSILMATLFSLLMLTAHLRGIETRNPAWFLLSVLCCYFALYSKEHSVMIPFVAALLTIALRGRELPWRALGFTFLAYALLSLSVVYQVKSVIATSYEPESADILAQLASESQLPHNLYLVSLLSQSFNFFKYIFFWLAPITSWMSIDIQQSIIDTTAQPLYWLSAAAFIAWCLTGFMLVWRQGMHALLGFAMVAPALLYATEFASIRIQEPFVLYRSYLWAPALFAATPLLLYKLKPRYIMAIGIVVAASLTTLAHERLATFDSSYILWNDAVKLAERDNIKTPMRARQYYNRGTASLAAKHPQDALADFDRALTFSHKYLQIYQSRGIALMQLGRYPEARASLDQALAINPNFTQALLTRSVICSKLGDQACADRDSKKACELGDFLACYYVKKKNHPEMKEFSMRFDKR
jgi:protein O-mannosyl-transferase